MPRIVKIDATGIVARAKAMMPPPLPGGAPQDAALIRSQLAWAHAMILSGARCPTSDPAFKARCEELLEVLDALRMAWCCHFHMNWKTGAKIDPRLVHPTPLDHVILSARVGPFQLYRYEPVRRIARACQAIEATAEVAERARSPKPAQKPAARPAFEVEEAARKEAEEASRKRAQADLEAFRAGTLREIRFPDEGSKAWFSEADRMRNAFATREAMQPQRQRQRQRVRQR
jgi:hypothetical protein